MIGAHIALLLLLAALSIFMAAVEAAFYLTKRRRLSHLAVQNPRVELVNRYLDDPPSLLMPVHIGTYTAHMGMTIVITALFLEYLDHWAMMVAFLAMMAYLLLFRLTVPYALVRGNPERSLLLLLPVFDSYARAMQPLVSSLRKRAAGGPPPVTEDSSPGNLKMPEVPPPPALETDEKRLVENLEQFTETLVRQVMTPRPDIVAIRADETVAELRRIMRETKYSRIPVYGENVDDILGVAEVRDLVDFDGDPAEPLRPLVRPVYLVPATKRIAELLKELQAQRTTFAVVIDEYGATAGIVSIEDIVEELVGEIKDEFDVESDPISIEPDGSMLVAGRVSVDRLEQALEAPLAESDDIGTVGGLVTSIFGRIPRPGERTAYKGFDVEVMDAERKRVNRVRFRRIAVTSPA
jgi:CBS domain containing-hemolysin-like protein